MTEARSWIDFENAELSVREQCRLLGIQRSAIYYEPQPETVANLQLMRLMDEEQLKHPARGSRQMVDYLEDQGFNVNRKRVHQPRHQSLLLHTELCQPVVFDGLGIQSPFDDSRQLVEHCGPWRFGNWSTARLLHAAQHNHRPQCPRSYHGSFGPVCITKKAL